jgi:preprotein translocase subunit YajC
LTSALINLAQAASPGGGSFIGTTGMMLMIFAVFYFLIIRPQQKKAKQHQNMLTELRVGDVVVTQGGIIGKISGIRDLELTVEVQQGVRLKVLRSHVSQKYTPGEQVKPDAKAS